MARMSVGLNAVVSQVFLPVFAFIPGRLNSPKKISVNSICIVHGKSLLFKIIFLANTDLSLIT
jgi:hypothetical protein